MASKLTIFIQQTLYANVRKIQGFYNDNDSVKYVMKIGDYFQVIMTLWLKRVKQDTLLCSMYIKMC